MGNKFLKNFTKTFSANIVSLIFITLSNIVIARTLGPEGKGIITLLTLFAFLVTIFLNSGLDDAFVYYLGSKKFTLNKVFSSALYTTFVLSFLSLFPLLFLLKDFIVSNFLKGIKENYYLIAIFYIPFLFLYRYSQAILRAIKDFSSYNILFIIRYVGDLFFLIIFINIFGLLGGVIALLISISFVSLVCFYTVYRKKEPSLLPEFSLYKKSLIFGMKSQPGLLFSFFDRRIDMFILNFFTSVVAVGYYSISVAIGNLLFYIPNSLSLVLFPEIASMEKEKSPVFTSVIARNALFIMILCAVLIGISGKFLILILFGEKFYPSLIPLLVLLPGVVMLGVTKIICSNFSGTGKPQYGTITTTISFTATLVLDFILIPRFAETGAALASTIAYTISSIVSITIFIRLWKFPVHKLLFLQKDDINRFLQFVKGKEV